VGTAKGSIDREGSRKKWGGRGTTAGFQGTSLISKKKGESERGGVKSREGIIGAFRGRVFLNGEVRGWGIQDKTGGGSIDIVKKNREGGKRVNRTMVTTELPKRFRLEGDTESGNFLNNTSLTDMVNLITGGGEGGHGGGGH